MKTQLDLSDIVQSPEFSQPISISRGGNGTWFKGKFTASFLNITTFGVISATDERDLRMIPEGDRVEEMKTIHTIIPVYATKSGQKSVKSDIITYNDEKYKVIKVMNAGDYGYWKAIIGKVGTVE